MVNRAKADRVKAGSREFARRRKLSIQGMPHPRMVILDPAYAGRVVWLVGRVMPILKDKGQRDPTLSPYRLARGDGVGNPRTFMVNER